MGLRAWADVGFTAVLVLVARLAGQLKGTGMWNYDCTSDKYVDLLACGGDVVGKMTGCYHR